MLRQPTDTSGYSGSDDGSPLDRGSLDGIAELDSIFAQSSEDTSDATSNDKSIANYAKRNSEAMRANPLLYQSPDPLMNLLNFDPACIFWKTPKVRETSLFPNSPSILSDRDKWHLTNDVYTWGLESYKKWTRDYGPYFSLRPFAAIFEGWDILDEEERSHPVLEALRWVDERVFGDWQSKAQRIAMMLIKIRLMNVSYLPKRFTTAVCC